MRLAFVSFVTFLFGCGGIDAPLFDGGGGDGTTGSDANGGDTGDPCAALIAELNGQLPNAIQCCPTCNIMQCGKQVDGLCCPLSVTSADYDAVKIYEATLAQIKQHGCAVDCPGSACSTNPSNVCNANSSCAQ